MKIKSPLITLAVMAAAAVPTAQANAKNLPSTAHFKVRITASQIISWKKNIQVRGQDGGCDSVVDQTGNGTSGLELHSGGWQPLTVKRLRGQVLFSFGGKQSATRALGHLERDGVSDTRQVSPPSNPFLCPKSGTPSAPDCGERDLPGGALVGMEWDRPADWPDFAGPAPLAPSIFLVGPFSHDPTELSHAMSFRDCPGVSPDYLLGLSTSEGYDTGAAALPVSKLFGKQKRFQVHTQLKRTTNSPLVSGVSGSFPVSTQLRWKVEFERTRRSH
jgi:hypothetical protein